MEPTPILPHTVHFLLQYIAPPSQLTEPLPSNLVSKSLLQRHHFLQLTPDFPEEYLCWPTADRGECIQLLESFPDLVRDDPGLFVVEYTSDDEATLAHVAILPQLRVVFQWEDDWRFHDVALMPFPPRSHKALADAMSAAKWKMNGFPSAAFQIQVESSADADTSEDDYWGQYGNNDDDSGARITRNFSKQDVTTEDAYWAQYASVHGTADSTIPSPLPMNHSKVQATVGNGAGAEGRSILIDYSAMHPPTHPPGFGPPSPEALVRRLNAISPRRKRFSFDSLSGFSPDATKLSPRLPPGGLSNSTTRAGAVQAHVGSSEMRSPVIGIVRDNAIAVKDSIRGVYQLWKSGRHYGITNDGGSAGDDEDYKLFMQLVQDAIYPLRT